MQRPSYLRVTAPVQSAPTQREGKLKCHGAPNKPCVRSDFGVGHFPPGPGSLSTTPSWLPTRPDCRSQPTGRVPQPTQQQEAAAQPLPRPPPPPANPRSASPARAAPPRPITPIQPCPAARCVAADRRRWRHIPPQVAALAAPALHQAPNAPHALSPRLSQGGHGAGGRQPAACRRRGGGRVGALWHPLRRRPVGHQRAQPAARHAADAARARVWRHHPRQPFPGAGRHNGGVQQERDARPVAHHRPACRAGGEGEGAPAQRLAHERHRK